MRVLLWFAPIIACGSSAFADSTPAYTWVGPTNVTSGSSSEGGGYASGDEALVEGNCFNYGGSCQIELSTSQELDVTTPGQFDITVIESIFTSVDACNPGLGCADEAIDDLTDTDYAIDPVGNEFSLDETNATVTSPFDPSNPLGSGYASANYEQTFTADETLGTGDYYVTTYFNGSLANSPGDQQLFYSTTIRIDPVPEPRLAAFLILAATIILVRHKTITSSAPGGCEKRRPRRLGVVTNAPC